MYLYIYTEESQCGSDAAEELWKHLFMFCRAKQVQSFSVDLCLLACCQGLSYYCIRPNYITKQKWKQPSTRPRHRKNACMCDLTWLGWLRCCLGFEARKNIRTWWKSCWGSHGSSQVDHHSSPSVTSHRASNHRYHRWAFVQPQPKCWTVGWNFVEPDPEWESFEILHKEGAHCCNRKLRPIKRRICLRILKQ